MKKLTESEITNCMYNFGWTWVSGEYTNRRSLLMMRCANGHVLKRSSIDRHNRSRWKIKEYSSTVGVCEGIK